MLSTRSSVLVSARRRCLRQRTMASAAAVAPAASVKLNDAVSVSPIILGCWQLGERGLNAAQAVDALVAHAEHVPTTSLDTADIYGPSESLVGNFVKTWAARHPDGPKPVVCTKCVTNDLSPQNVRAGVRRSLAKLGLPSVDLIAFHCWEYGSGGYVRACQELDLLRKEGLIKAVGVTNMDVKRLREVMDAHVPIVSNQVQYSLLDRRPENGLLAFAKQRNVKLLAYGSVAGGLLSDAWFGVPPPTRAQLATASLRMYSASLSLWCGSDWALFQELLAACKDVGARHGGAPIAAVAVRYVLDALDAEGAGGSAIIGVRGTKYVAQTEAALKFKLAPEDLAQLRAVLRKGAAPVGDVYSRERGE